MLYASLQISRTEEEHGREVNKSIILSCNKKYVIQAPHQNWNVVEMGGLMWSSTLLNMPFPLTLVKIHLFYFSREDTFRNVCSKVY